MNSFLVALWKKRKKVLTYSEILFFGLDQIDFRHVMTHFLEYLIYEDMNSDSQFHSNVLYQNTFLLFDPSCALERDNGPGVVEFGPLDCTAARTLPGAC